MEKQDRIRAVSAQALCALSDLPDPGAKGFVVAGRGVFVARQGDEVFGYVNDCPHLNRPLNHQPDQFLDTERKHIVCATHGATFSMTGGQCLFGPCDGKGLKPFPVVVRDGKVFAA